MSYVGTEKWGREQARKMFPIRPCEVCGATATVDRHHRDSNRVNNTSQNIEFLCRKHHMEAHRLGDGRTGGGAREGMGELQRNRALERYRQAFDLRRAGLSDKAIACQMGFHRASVQRWFHKYDR